MTFKEMVIKHLEDTDGNFDDDFFRQIVELYNESLVMEDVLWVAEEYYRMAYDDTFGMALFVVLTIQEKKRILDDSQKI